MEEYLKELCAPHFWPIVITIGVMIILMASGVAIGPLLKKLLDAGLKRLSGESVEVVVNPGRTGGEEMVCDPEKCTTVVKIKQQQKRNVSDIKEFNTKIEHLTELFFHKLTFIGQQNAVMLRAMVKTGALQESDIPKEVQ